MQPYIRPAREPQPEPQDNLEQQLRRREVSRSGGPEEQTIVYDNGQSITRRVETIENRRNIEAVSGKGRSQVIATETFNSRSGLYSESSPEQGFSNFRREELIGYPELKPFVDEIVARTADTKLRAVEPAIVHVPAILFGHGNIPPWALLHPVVIWQIAKGTIYPFEKEHVFRLPEGQDYFAEKGRLLDPARIDENYDGYVACISPHGIFGKSPDDEEPGGLEVKIFNPRQVASTPKTNSAAPQMPNRDNTLFELSIYQNRSAKDAEFNLSIFDLRREKINAVEGLTLASIEEQRGSGFYIRVDEELMNALERVSPLPIEHGDCGRSIGFPKLNDEYQALRMSAHQSSLRVRELKKSSAGIVADLNDERRWINIANSDAALGEPQPADELLLRRIRQVKALDVNNQPAWVEEVSMMTVPRESAELVRAVLELSDPEKRLIGLTAHEGAILRLEDPQ